MCSKKAETEKYERLRFGTAENNRRDSVFF